MIDNLQAMIAALQGQGGPRETHDNNTMIPGLNDIAPSNPEFMRVGGLGQIPLKDMGLMPQPPVNNGGLSGLGQIPLSEIQMLQNGR